MDLSFTETFGCTPVAGDPLPSNPNNVEPYVWRFICAVYPSAPNLALASFSEEKALTDAADEIERLKRERAEMVRGHQNAEHAMLDNLAEARASIERLQRELADWKQADTDRCLELFDVREKHGNALIERDRLRTALDAMRKERDHYLHLYNREWRANTEAGRMPAAVSTAGRPAAKEGDPCDRCGRQWQSSVVLQGRLHHCCIAQETSGVKTGYMGDINGPGCDPDTG